MQKTPTSDQFSGFHGIVIPGTLPKRFPAGEFGTPCALIIGERTASTDTKTSLTAALRDFEVAV